MTIMTRADEDIQQDVLAELEWEPRVRSNEIGVIAKDGVVTLIGRVDTYLQRTAAQDAAHRVRGVKAVANEIEVQLPSAAERGDADIAAAAAQALEWDAAVPFDKIDVTVAKGWVTLHGEVSWQYQKQDAERVVRRLAGVTGVSNLLTVEPHLSATDLKQKIERALVRSAEADAERIQVEVQGSEILLKGTVPAAAEKRAAERAAWSAPGVTSVDNRIAVSW